MPSNVHVYRINCTFPRVSFSLCKELKSKKKPDHTLNKNLAKCHECRIYCLIVLFPFFCILHLCQCRMLFNFRDVSATALETLPSHGLQSVMMLVARSAFLLKRLPPLNSLESLREAHLTYPSHCCALLSWDTHRFLVFLFFFLKQTECYCQLINISYINLTSSSANFQSGVSEVQETLSKENYS